MIQLQLPKGPDGQVGPAGTAWPPGMPVSLPLMGAYTVSTLPQIYGKNYPLSQFH